MKAPYLVMLEAIAPGFVVLLMPSLPAIAQISAAPDGTNTNVVQSGNTFNITNGTQAGSNQFHSFQQFGLNQGQVANFLSNPAIQNILGRVTGGDASIINGRIQVTGSNANLYLMNPAGIVFGGNAILNVPGSFTATTANGIGIGNGWFNATGANNYASLVGQPNAFAFTNAQPGNILNFGNLAVGQGQTITLVGGTVINTGTTSGGTVNVVAIPGERMVRVTPQGSLLSLELPTETRTAVKPSAVTPLSLPALLTGGDVGSATGVTVENGIAKLTSSNTPITLGDVVAKTIAAQTTNLSAANNVTLVESQLRTTGDLTVRANNTVVVRDSVTNPVAIRAGRHLTIQGDRGIDALALNHSQPAFQSGGDLNLISNGIISGDAHYVSGGNLSMQTLSGAPGQFISLYDPIISSNGNVTFGDYTGISLKVEAKGNITTGNINIIGTDPAFALAPVGSDRRLLSDFRTVILRAGVPTLQETGAAANPSPNTPFTVDAEGTTFNGTNLSATTGRVTVGNPADPSIRSINAQYVDISAPNGITINTPVQANYVKLTANSGNVTVHSIRTEFGGGSAIRGDIDITAGGQFRATGTLDAIGLNGYATGLKNYVLVDPNLVPFLVNKTGDTKANVEAAIQASNPASGLQKMYVNTPISISAGIGTIRIRYGGGGPITPLSDGVTLEGGNTPFVIGPKVTPNPGDPYLIRDPANDYSTFVTTPFSLNKNESYTNATIPAGSSGTVGAIIRTVVIDGSLTVSTQNRVIGSISPTAVSSSTVAPSAQTPTQSQSTVTSNAVNTVGQDAVQRTFVSQAVCAPTETPTTNDISVATRSQSVPNPCSTATDEQQILKVLGEEEKPAPR